MKVASALEGLNERRLGLNHYFITLLPHPAYHLIHEQKICFDKCAVPAPIPLADED